MNFRSVIAILVAIVVAGAALCAIPPATAQEMGPLLHPLADASVERAEIAAGKRPDGSDLIVTLSTQPAQGEAKRPVVILLHGGAPAGVPPASVWPIFETWGNALAASGIGAVMFDHHLGYPKRDLDTALAELDVVLAWIKDHGAAHGLDTARVSLFSFSAGGLFTPSLLDPARPLQVQRIAMFYPLTGVVEGSPSAAGIDATLADRMTLAKAAGRVADSTVSLLILRAGADEIPGLLGLLDAGIAALLAADARVDVINLPGAPHSFDYRTDTATVREVIVRAIAFAQQP